MNAKQAVGLIGAIFVLVGCFLPIANIPIYGGVNYLFPPGGGVGDGMIVAALAVLGLLGALRGGSALLLIGSILGTLVFGYTMNKLLGVLGESREAEGLAGAMFSTARVGAGAGVIGLGLVLMFVAGIMPKTATAAAAAPTLVKCPSCAEAIQLEAKKCRFCGELLAK